MPRVKGIERLMRLWRWRKDGAGEAVPEETEAIPAPDLSGEKALQVYPVNEPYAYIVIQDTAPLTYKVWEVGLTEGEQELLKEMKSRLYEVINVDFVAADGAEQFLEGKVEEIARDFSLKLAPASRQRIMYYVTRDLIGYGKLDPILSDKRVEDISANGPGLPVYVYHREYGSLITNVVFDHVELDSLIYKLSQRASKHISMARPLVDASLPNRDRLQLTIGSEITTRGSTFTIRKFRELPFTPIDLINSGTFSVEMMAYFWLAVENGFNILIAGGTASGKTSVLNSISMFIPGSSKIVSIEDTREVNLLHENWIPALTREAEAEGRSIDMFALLRSALRQRPEYILVGEVRGREAYTLFQAMATGHITFSTIHADSAEAVVKRLTKPPIDVPLMLLDSLDIITLHAMVRLGPKRVRRCLKVLEVLEVDFANERLKTNEIFRWRPDEFEFSGESKVYKEIMDKLTISEAQLEEEFARRVRILRRLQEKGPNDFFEMSRLFFQYSMDPKGTAEKLGVG